ncbi:hypothetical protein F2Q68_00001877 [Brassica cretica]|uniref:Uncharacterized protein n=1 Tax=Brassica cretica TaxID=69181 RepID=A0A8S9J9T6_BRACR|nr:hypothetical protein F2Q68_00001877 [Brassica cretica]
MTRFHGDTWRFTWVKKKVTFAEFWCPLFTLTILCSVSCSENPKKSMDSDTKEASQYLVCIQTSNVSKPESLPG